MRGRRGKFWPGSLGGWLDALLKLGAITGGVFALWQYVETREDLRIAHSMSFLERFNDETLSSSRMEIEKATLDVQKQRLLSLSQTGTLSPKDRDRLALFIAYDWNDGTGQAANLNLITGFFGELDVCVTKSLCDASLAHHTLGAYAITFWDNFEPYVRDRRTIEGKEYGAGMEHFVEMAKRKPQPKTLPWHD